MRPAPLSPFDLSDPETFAGGVPHALFKRLRAEAPVSFCAERNGGTGFFSIANYAELVQISKNPQLFSSRLGTNIEDQPAAQLAQLQTILINMDPPQHVKYRRLVRRGFTPLAWMRAGSNSNRPSLVLARPSPWGSINGGCIWNSWLGRPSRTPKMRMRLPTGS